MQPLSQPPCHAYVMPKIFHVLQVTSLTEFDPMSLSKEETERFLLHQRQFGSPHKLVRLVDKAVMNFVAVGEDIAAENPEFQVQCTETMSPTPLIAPPLAMLQHAICCTVSICI